MTIDNIVRADEAATPLALSVAAQRAADAKPVDILETWFSGLSKGTRLVYGRAMRRFAAWATDEDHDGGSAPEVAMRVLVEAGSVAARQQALAWRAAMEAEGLTSSTVQSMLAALASCVAAFADAGVVDWTLPRIAPKVERRKDRAGPGRDAVAAIIERLERLVAELPPSRERLSAIRDRALIRLLHNSALRRGSLSALRVGDVDLDADGGPQLLLQLKGKKERVRLLIDEQSAGSLAEWLAASGGVDDDAPVFVRVRSHKVLPTDGPLSGDGIRRIVALRAKEAGVTVPVRPHGLRHSAATHVVRNGGTVEEVRRLGGWASLATVASYIDAVDDDRREALRKVAL